MSDEILDYIERMERMTARAVEPVTKPKGARALRKMYPINMRAIQTLALAGCDNTQIAGFLGIKPTVFDQIIRKQRGLGPAIEGWRAGGEAALLVTIHALATRRDPVTNMPDPDVPMLKWASKNRLGWKERAGEDETPNGATWIVETRSKMSVDQWESTYRGPTIDGKADEQD